MNPFLSIVKKMRLSSALIMTGYTESIISTGFCKAATRMRVLSGVYYGKNVPLFRKNQNRPEYSLVKKIGKITYKVRVHFSNTSTETMSDKIKRMLKNEIQQM